MTTPLNGTIWARSATGVIGRGNAMPWHLPEDFEHFRFVTTGPPVIMGRRTWESLPPKSRPLPGRTNIVITSDAGRCVPTALSARNLTEALGFSDRQDGAEPIWTIGGGRVYAEAVRLADTAVIARVDSAVDGARSPPPSAGNGSWKYRPWRAAGALPRTACATASKRGRGPDPGEPGGCCVDPDFPLPGTPATTRWPPGDRSSPASTPPASVPRLNCWVSRRRSAVSALFFMPMTMRRRPSHGCRPMRRRRGLEHGR